jgi:hypothetical protein
MLVYMYLYMFITKRKNEKGVELYENQSTRISQALNHIYDCYEACPVTDRVLNEIVA